LGVVANTVVLQKTLARLRFSLIMLRKVIKSTLPVEIYYYAGEMTDQKIRDEFTTEYGVTLVESSIPKVHGKLWSK
jgi:hypothetical protein